MRLNAKFERLERERAQRRRDEEAELARLLCDTYAELTYEQALKHAKEKLHKERQSA